MSAVPNSPFANEPLERVKRWMQENALMGLVPLDSVIQAFPDMHAETVRTALGTLRKQLLIGAHVEEGRVSYIWMKERAPGEAPLRQRGTSLRATPQPPKKPEESTGTWPRKEEKREDPPRPLVKPPVPSVSSREVPPKPKTLAERLYEAALLMDVDAFRLAEVCEVAGIELWQGRGPIRAMVQEGRFFSQGRTAACRYSLKPFGAPEKVPGFKPVSTYADKPFPKDIEIGSVSLVTPSLKFPAPREAVVIEIDRWKDSPPPRAAQSGETGGAQSAPPAEPDILARIPSFRGMLVVMNSPEPIAAITADGDVVLLDGPDHVIISRRYARAIAKLFQRNSGLLDG